MTETLPARPSGFVRPGRLIRPGAIALVTLLSLPIAFYGLAFPFSPELNPEFFGRLMALPWYAHAHFLGSGTALLVGGLQFSRRCTAGPAASISSACWSAGSAASASR